MNNLIITNNGRALMARVLNNQTSVKFTKVVTSDYSYTNSNLQSLTEILNIKQTFNVSNVVIKNLTQVELTAVFNNEYLTNAYYIRTLGVYAKDSNNSEILYAVAVEPSNPDYLYAFSSGSLESISYKLILSVANSNSVDLVVSDNGYAAESDLVEHTQTLVTKADGSHGIRYYNKMLQYRNNNNQWTTIATYGVPELLGVDNSRYQNGSLRFYVTWNDPTDETDEYTGISTNWASTKLVMSTNHAPQTSEDGTLLVTNTTRNQYSNTPYTVSGLTLNQTYYLRLFTTSTDNRETPDDNIFVGTAVNMDNYQVTIEITNSGASYNATYKKNGSTISAPSASTWNTIFGVKPYYIPIYSTPEDFGDALDEYNVLKWDLCTDNRTNQLYYYDDPSEANVMIGFPRRGIKISKNTSGNPKIIVDITTDPYDSNYSYKAFERGSSKKDRFFIGAYEGALLEDEDETNRLMSFDQYTYNDITGYDIAPACQYTIDDFINYAKVNNTSYGGSAPGVEDSQYGITGFYQYTYIQALFVLKYGSLNTQEALSKGFTKTSNTAPLVPGDKFTDAFKSVSDYTNHNSDADVRPSKFLGLVNMWGNMYEFLDGIYVSSNRNMFTTTKLGTTINTTNYSAVATNVSTYDSAFIKDVYGTSDCGFIAQTVSDTDASGSKYYCDKGSVMASCAGRTGGNWNTGDKAGLFHLEINKATNYAARFCGARLLYL